MLEIYSRVKIISSSHIKDGVLEGDIGYIIEVYKDAYEVEFSNKEGISFAQIVLEPFELVECPE
jgi:hypothetical protein